jgi:hypothetical protein
MLETFWNCRYIGQKVKSEIGKKLASVFHLRIILTMKRLFFGYLLIKFLIDFVEPQSIRLIPMPEVSHYRSSREWRLYSNAQFGLSQIGNTATAQFTNLN